METSYELSTEPTVNDQEYDDADNPIWQTAVYNAVHGGWRFANMGGATALDRIAQLIGPANGRKTLLELCSGMGDPSAYLATKYGYTVTGVELNRFQVQRAWQVASQRGVMGLVSFIHANVIEWEPTACFDAIYSLDSLVYVPRLAELFCKCRQALRPAGWLAIVELTAGPAIDDSKREYARRDGFVNVLSTTEYADLLQHAGFRQILAEDLTPLGQSCFETIHTSLQENREGLIQACGERAWSSWNNLSSVYAEAFRARQYSYSLIHAQL